MWNKFQTDFVQLPKPIFATIVQQLDRSTWQISCLGSYYRARLDDSCCTIKLQPGAQVKAIARENSILMVIVPN